LPIVNIGTSTAANGATLNPCQRKTFYAAGLYWAWYSDGTNLGYRTSKSGLSGTWSSFQSIRACVESRFFSVWYDGRYCYYAYGSDSTNSALVCRRGTPLANGTISWSADEQTAVAADANNILGRPFICVDGSGHMVIAYVFGANASAETPYVTMSGNTDGTWGTTPSGFPYQVNSTSADWRVAVVPEYGASQGFVVVYGRGGGYGVKLRHYDGSTPWWAEKTTSSTLSVNAYFSTIASPNSVHVVFHRTTDFYLIHDELVLSTNNFEATLTVQASVAQHSAPQLVYDRWNSNLLCFWMGSPTAGHIYYKKRGLFGGSWSGIIDWCTETETVWSNNTLNGFYAIFEGRIGFEWSTSTTSPYNIKYNELVTAFQQRTLKTRAALRRDRAGFSKTLVISEVMR